MSANKGRGEEDCRVGEGSHLHHMMYISSWQGCGQEVLFTVVVVAGEDKYTTLSRGLG
jgi:hypothetical protein